MFPTVAMTGPVVAPSGTVATICVSLQVLIAAVAPLKLAVLTGLLPCVAPNPDPLIVTVAPSISAELIGVANHFHPIRQTSACAIRLLHGDCRVRPIFHVGGNRRCVVDGEWGHVCGARTQSFADHH